LPGCMWVVYGRGSGPVWLCMTVMSITLVFGSPQ